MVEKPGVLIKLAQERVTIHVARHDPTVVGVWQFHPASGGKRRGWVVPIREHREPLGVGKQQGEKTRLCFAESPSLEPSISELKLGAAGGTTRNPEVALVFAEPSL